MLALSAFNCPILKIINYYELCNTQDSFVHNNTLPYAELQFLACMYDVKTLFYIDIQCFVAAMFCGCDLHIATPHCIQSVLNIANHNRLDNSSEPRNRESIKWDCTIVLQHIEFHLVSSRPWAGGPLLDAPYWHIHPLHRPHSVLPGLPQGLWLYCYFDGCLFARVAFTKAWTSSDAL